MAFSSNTDLGIMGSAMISVDGSSDAAGPQFFVDQAAVARPKSAFQRKNAGGGGGAGGGRGGLGGRHAPKAMTNDVLPRTHATMADEASRYVASKPPKPTAPKANPFREQKPPPTNFRVMYDRGDLPLRIKGGTHKFVHWHIADAQTQAPGGLKQAPSFHREQGGDEYEEAKGRFLSQLDYSVWLPLFFEGLREQKDPLRFLAVTATKDLLAAGSYAKVAPVVPLIVLPIRQALNTREPATVRRTITAIKQLIAVPDDPSTGAMVGEALAPHFKHFLPMFNLFKSNPAFAKSDADYSTSLGEVMDETMLMLAEHGGPGAAHEINRVVPLWVPPPPAAKKKVDMVRF